MFCFVIFLSWIYNLRWPKNTAPHGPPYGSGPQTTVRTGPQTPLYGSPIKTIIKMPIRDLAYYLFFLLLLPPSLWCWKEDLCTSKKTDNLANLRIRCQPPVASAILFGSMLLMFSDSSQTSKIRHSISLFLSHATMDGMGLQISWKYISVVYKFSSTLQKEYIWITGLPYFCVARHRLPNLICLSNQIKTLMQTLCFCCV